VNRPFRRWALAIPFLLTLTLNASAETVAETARAWGLIGAWSLDCSVAPDRGQGAVLAYEIASGDRVVHRRDFGDASDAIATGTANTPSGMANSPPTATQLRHSISATNFPIPRQLIAMPATRACGTRIACNSC